jgi:hypothetical protein
MATGPTYPKKRPVFFAILSTVCFSACFIFGSLGSFSGWIFGGATLFFGFMTVFDLIPPSKKVIRKKKDVRTTGDKAYIEYHLTMVISLLLGGLLLALIIVFFAL